jgi:hypothetical protein
MKQLLLGLVLACAGGCVWPPVPTPIPTPDGGASCATACAHLADLGCKAASPTAKGATCASVCENAEAGGVIRWGVDCVVLATSCEAADACGGAT